jgi:hypothetical protein
MYIGTYCQYVKEKGCWSCKKWQEPKRLDLLPFLRVVAPPFGHVRFGGNKFLHGLAVIFLARLERPFLARISYLTGVGDKKFMFLHNPLRDLVRPNSSGFYPGIIRYKFKATLGTVHNQGCMQWVGSKDNAICVQREGALLTISFW